MQLRRQFGGGHGIFLHLVKATTVHAPRIANDARGEAVPLT